MQKEAAERLRRGESYFARAANGNVLEVTVEEHKALVEAGARAV